MNDHFWRELKVWDFCFHTNGTKSQHFTYCKVIWFTSKKVAVLNSNCETLVDANSLAKISKDWLWDIEKRKAIVVDIDGTFLNETWLYGKEVVNYEVLIEINKHLADWVFVIFLTNRDANKYKNETHDAISFYLKDTSKYYNIIMNYFTDIKNEEQHKESNIKYIIKNYNVINWYEDNPAIQKIAEKYNIPFTLVTK